MDGISVKGIMARDFTGYTDDCLIYRMVPVVFFNRSKLAANIFGPDHTGWSLDWNKYTTVEQSLIRTGLTYKHGKTTFKEPKNYRVVELNVGKVKTLDQITGLKHTPTRRIPEIKGHPNNESHSSLYYMDVEVRMKLYDILDEVINIDRVAVDEIVEEKRKSYTSF